MDRATLSKCWEANHAGWWTIDGVIRGERPNARRGFAWTCDPNGGGASLHLLRLREKTAAERLDGLIGEAAKARSAIWAHASEFSTPHNLIDIMRRAGFQHCKRFEALGCNLSDLPKAQKRKDVRVGLLDDYSMFDADVAYPGIGPITTKTRRAVLEQAERRWRHRPDDVIRIMAHVGDVPAATATVFLEGGIAGLYDVATLDAYRGVGLARLSVLAALDEARRRRATHAGTVASAEAEALYAQLGFQPVGWLSMLYYSKTKLDRVRQAAAA